MLITEKQEDITAIHPICIHITIMRHHGILHSILDSTEDITIIVILVGTGIWEIVSEVVTQQAGIVNRVTL